MLKKIIILLLAILPFQAQALELTVTLSKGSAEGSWKVDYVFSQPVAELSFERTPYAFVESSWSVTSPGADLVLSSLKVVFEVPAKALSTEIEAPYDEVIRGFYTPFLNFSDGSSALFIAHYLPSQVNVDNEWVSIDAITKRLTIDAPKPDRLWFVESEEIKGRELTMQDLRQYAYVGRLDVHHNDQLDLILDPKLPEWITEAYEKATVELLTYYRSQTNALLGFRPFFLINYKPGSQRPRIDGGAINRQVAINMVGDGWQQNPEQNRVNVLSLMAHEIAHLWNAQYWNTTEETPVWMFEGGANYFAQKALLNLGYITSTAYEHNVRQKAEACGHILTQYSLDRLPNRLDYYTCGEALYYLGDSMLGNPKGLKFWSLIVDHHSGSSYTQEDFIRALENPKVSSEDINSLNAIFSGESRDFSRLIQKYLPAPSTANPSGGM